MNNLVVLDIEIYPNYSLFAFKNIDNGKIVTIEIKGKDNCLSIDKHKQLNTIMQKRTTFGFNSRNYDVPIILYALKQKSAEQLWKMSNRIIENNIPGWKTRNDFGLVLPKTIDHFDIQEPSPGVKVSLKLYGARMYSEYLQDLPIEPGSILTSEDMNSIKEYCVNDLNTTIDLYDKVKDRIQLRIDMSGKYGQDLRSKSDAQIAEAVFKSEFKKKRPNKSFYPPKLSENSVFKYNTPDFISFENSKLNIALDIISNHNFELDAKGSIKLPLELKKMKITIGKTTYQLGIGGIHSNEKSQAIIPNKNQILVDKDVSSYYPSIILNLGLYPNHLGPMFLDIYKNIVNERLQAKKEKNKTVNEALKIVINGSFGKLGSKYSILYSPDLMMTVTLTGQLALLMLIEKLENNGISVISANTDGFVCIMNKDIYETYDSICFDWELKTNFKLEETQYKALYSRDVNNYLAIKEKSNDLGQGFILKSNVSKGKGIFTINELSKNPHGAICILAVEAFLTSNIPIEKTIRGCDIISQFLFVRSVTGGAIFRDEYLGRVVRWIYSKKGDTIRYKKNGNKVAKSDGSRPIMTLGEFPEDIDYDRYIDEATTILKDIGVK